MTYRSREDQLEAELAEAKRQLEKERASNKIYRRLAVSNDAVWLITGGTTVMGTLVFGMAAQSRGLQTAALVIPVMMPSLFLLVLQLFFSRKFRK